MSDFFDFIGIWLTLLVGAALLFVAVATPLALFERAACDNTLAAMNKGGEWKLAGGCFVQMDGYQLPLAAYLERTVPQNIEVRP